LATIQRPGAPGTLGYIGAFLEDFANSDGVQRSGLYGNCWIQSTNGSWVNYPEVYFNASIPLPSQTDYDGELAGTLFLLETGGTTTNYTSVQTWHYLNVSQSRLVAPNFVPVLRILDLVGNMPNPSISLAWSSQETGWEVETSKTLSSGAAWGPIAVEPILTNSQYQVTVTNIVGTAFFRLRKT
jgi:hypothetical protein